MPNSLQHIAANLYEDITGEKYYLLKYEEREKWEKAVTNMKETIREQVVDDITESLNNLFS